MAVIRAFASLAITPAVLAVPRAADACSCLSLRHHGQSHRAFDSDPESFLNRQGDPYISGKQIPTLALRTFLH